MQKTNNSDSGEQAQRNLRKMWPAIINLVNSHADYWRAQTQKANDPQPEKIRFWTMWAAIGTCVGTVLAFVAAVAIWKQFGAMIDANTASDVALKLDQRAWLGVKEIEADATIGKSFSEVVHIRNSGKTPTINMRFNAGLEKGTSLPDVRNYCQVAMKDKKRGTLAPGAIYSIPGKADAWGKLTGSWSRDSDGQEVYVVGCILYGDVFNRPHWLTYCSRWLNDISAFVDCESGNEAGDGNGPNPN